MKEDSGRGCWRQRLESFSAACNRRHNSKNFWISKSKLVRALTSKGISSLEFRHIRFNSVARLCHWGPRVLSIFWLSHPQLSVPCLQVWTLTVARWAAAAPSITFSHKNIQKPWENILFLCLLLKVRKTFPEAPPFHFPSNSLARILSLVSRM